MNPIIWVSRSLRLISWMIGVYFSHSLGHRLGGNHSGLRDQHTSLGTLKQILGDLGALPRTRVALQDQDLMDSVLDEELLLRRIYRQRMIELQLVEYAKLQTAELFAVKYLEDFLAA